MENKNTELLALKQQQIEKYNILIVLQGELNAIHDEQKYCKKLHMKHMQTAQNKLKYEENVAKLQEISKHQKLEITKLRREIQTLRLKTRPQHQQILSNKRITLDRKAPQILSFPGDYIIDAGQDDEESTKSFSSRVSNASNMSTESIVSLPSKASSII